MPWGQDVNFALEPSVAVNPMFGQVASEMRGREYKKDINTARIEAERKFHSERQQRLAQPLEDELTQLRQQLSELQSKRDQLGAQKLNQDLDAREANKIEPQTQEETQMFPTASNGGIGGSRSPDLSGVNPNYPTGESQGSVTKNYYQQEPVKSEVSGYGNPYGIGNSNEETPLLGGSRQSDLSGVNPNANPPVGYDQNPSYMKGYGPLSNGRLPLEPLSKAQIPSSQVAPQLQLFPKKKTGRYF